MHVHHQYQEDDNVVILVKKQLSAYPSFFLKETIKYINGIYGDTYAFRLYINPGFMPYNLDCDFLVNYIDGKFIYSAEVNIVSNTITGCVFGLVREHMKRAQFEIAQLTRVWESRDEIYQIEVVDYR